MAYNAMFNREAVSDWICLCVLKNARNDIYRKKRALGQTIIVPITRELLLRLPRKIKFFFWSITVNDTVFWKLKIHVGCGWPITICVKVWMQQIIYYSKLFKTQSDEKKEPYSVKNHQVYFTQSVADKHTTPPALKSTFCALKVKRE